MLQTKYGQDVWVRLQQVASGVTEVENGTLEALKAIPDEHMELVRTRGGLSLHCVD